MAAFVVVLTGCGGEKSTVEKALETPAIDPASPESALQQMIDLAEADDWDTYVDFFYGEKDKFRDESDRDKVVARFRDEWGATVVEQLSTLRDVKPEIIDDGKRASFALPDGNAFYLYKSDGGKWTFHL
jgi:hypothetical protein